MSPERIAVVEPRCWGLEHVPFNTALIATVQEAYPGAALDVYGEPGHLQAIRELLGCTRPLQTKSIEWRPMRVPVRWAMGWPRSVAIRSLFADLDAALLERPAGALVFTNSDPLVLAYVKARLFSGWKRRATLIVFHELLSVLEGRRSSRRWLLSSALAAPHPDGLKYLVLSESIRAQLAQLAPRTARHVVSIDHPSLLGDVPGPETHHAPPPLKFGFIGTGRNVKRVVEFARLAKEVRARCRDAEFHIIGSVGREVPRDQLEELRYADHRLPLREFGDGIRSLSHAVWLGDPHHYGLVASGSLVDALALGLPVICQRGPLCDHLFGRLGDIGFRCETMADVRDQVLRIVADFSVDRYQAQCESLRHARLYLSPESCAGTVRLALSGRDSR